MTTDQDAPSARLRTTPSIVYAFDARGICTMSEGPGLAQLGLSAGEMVGLDLFEVYADDELLLSNMRRVIDGETFVFSREVGGRAFETFLQPLSSRTDEPAGALGVVSDLTEQRRLEAETQEHERRLQSLVALDAALARDVVDLPLLLDTAIGAATAGTASSGAVWLLDRDTDRMRLSAFSAARTAGGAELRPSGDRALSEQIDLDPSLAEGIDRARHLDLGDDAGARDFFGDAPILSWLRDSGVHSVLRVPLRARGTLLGSLDLARRGEAPRFHEKDTDFAVDVAERVAMALDNALLLRSQREMLEEQAKFKALADATSDLIAMTDTESVATYVNARVAGVGEGWLGSTMHDIFGSSVVEDVADEVERSLAARGRWRGDLTLRDAATTTVAHAEAFHIFHPESGDPLGTVWVAQDVTELRSAERALSDLAEQRRHLLTRLVDAQDAERAHIAAEVHDDSVQSLAAVDLRLGLLSRRIAADAPHLSEYVEPLRTTVSEATDRLRTLLFDLTPPDLDHGLASALRETAREIFDGSSTEVEVVTEAEIDLAGALPLFTLRVAHRIAREALINARKHARADNVQVCVRGRDGGIEVRVLDDGIGIPADRAVPTAGHLGLSSMQDRAQIAGGAWSVARRPDAGTEVLLWLPGEPDPSPGPSPGPVA